VECLNTLLANSDISLCFDECAESLVGSFCAETAKETHPNNV
jgi:hypothetical protein